MKQLLFYLCYWFVSILILSLILLSTSYTFSQALLVSCSILPGVLMAKYMGRNLSSKKRKDTICGWIYLSLAIPFLTYLIIFCIHLYFINVYTESILMNPLFILVIVAGFTLLNIYLEKKVLLGVQIEPEKDIEFISERRKVKIELSQIKYIESNDNEVYVFSLDGNSYRTKMKISHWAEVLDSRFIRIHRSFIVNKDLITRREADCVYIGDQRLEISRKYRTEIG